MCLVTLLSVFLVAGICTGQDDKIFNGEIATPHAYPWSAHLLYSTDNGITYRHFCGGSLISRRHVLTAAHCFFEGDYTFAVQFGDHNFTVDEGTEKTVGIKSWILHPKWETNYEDIAIIVLSEAVRSTNEIAPIDILRSPKYHARLEASQKICTLAGWGLTKLYTGWVISDVLQTLSIKLVDSATCIERGNNLYPGSFCYEAAKEVCSGSCNGDSGSGIFTKRKGAYILVGVHSYRMNSYDGCATGMKGATKVVDYYDWVDSIIS